MPKLTLRHLFAVVTIVAMLVVSADCNQRKAEQIRQGVKDVDQHANEIRRQVEDQPAHSD
jgi:hypothetical protein